VTIDGQSLTRSQTGTVHRHCTASAIPPALAVPFKQGELGELRLTPLTCLPPLLEQAPQSTDELHEVCRHVKAAVAQALAASLLKAGP
jgi:hypothetical protein